MIKGEFLYQKRIERGLSQAQVASELGYSVQLISLWESGKNVPSITILAKYASILGVDLEGIIYSKNTKNNSHCDENNFEVEKFGKNIKKLRKKKGITQKELAVAIACPTNAIIRFEKSSSVPSVDQLIKLSDYFKVNIDNFYFVKDFDAPVIVNPLKKRFFPIFLPIIITVVVGGGATGTILAISNMNAKNQNNTVINSTSTEPGSPNNTDNPIIDNNTDNEEGNNEPVVTPTKDYLYFGKYPQSRVIDTDIVNALNLLTTTNSIGYYEYQDEEYIKINAYYNSIYAVDVDAGYYFDNDERIIDGDEYWFKVEPIKWQILNENDYEYFLLSSLLLDANVFDDDSSNYEKSSIREWLNDSFYNLAFAGVKDDVIQKEIDNSLSSTGLNVNPYICSNTLDYVSLLSNQEASNSNYAVDLVASTTEYYRAVGGNVNVNKNGSYMLRSPHNTSGSVIQTINTKGKIYVSNDVYRPTGGIRPIITIKK